MTGTTSIGVAGGALENLLPAGAAERVHDPA